MDRTLGALSEIAYHLDVARTMDLITDEERRELESLGGRALCYAMKLAMSLQTDSPAG